MHHELLNPLVTQEEAKVTINIASMLCYQFVTNTFALTSTPFCPHIVKEISLGTSINAPKPSDMITSDSDTIENLYAVVRILKDFNGLLHHQVYYLVSVSNMGKFRSMNDK